MAQCPVGRWTYGSNLLSERLNDQNGVNSEDRHSHTANTSRAPANGPAGCEWTGCLAKGASPRDTPAGRREFAMQMERGRAEEEAADYRPLRRGWCLGSEEFRQELIAAAEEHVGPSHYSAHRHESQQDKAIVREELKRAGWKAGRRRTCLNNARAIKQR